ncbi:hypothetical protein [Cytobacillus pseudoceanisediminis]|uniref:hypothetical protein n=1 Tax=Cytobacillus pseudoceanisediminis TaxID=3051614 RepID=UPI003C2F2628
MIAFNASSEKSPLLKVTISIFPSSVLKFFRLLSSVESAFSEVTGSESEMAAACHQKQQKYKTADFY